MIMMQQYRVELRLGYMATRTIDVTAYSHEQAYARAERQTGLTVLSTQLID